MKTLVLGLGNPLLADEGVGVHAARALIEEGCPENVAALDVGTAILDALPAIEEADRIIVVDAVKADGEPGSIYRMPIDAFMRPEVIASLHGFDIQRALALTDRSTRPDVVVIGVEPAEIAWSLELSPTVKKVLPDLLDLIREEIQCRSERFVP